MLFLISIVLLTRLNLTTSPVVTSAQGLFEGLKAYRKHDGKILLFRPEENALRLRMGAERMCMPSPTVEQFVEAVRLTVLANERWVMRRLTIPMILSFYIWISRFFHYLFCSSTSL